MSFRNIAAKLGVLLSMSIASSAQAAPAKAIFAGGCFWCMESEFEHEDGILAAVSGYTGGDAADANYDAVSAHKTKHVEAVEITYDPAKIDYAGLLKIYWGNIDPTDEGGQMYDRGAQYATVIYYGNDEEKKLAETSKAEVAKKLGKTIATRIEPAQTFYPAEDYHQNYYKTNPLHYQGYVAGSGRKEKLKKLWGE
ncbi:MAG: peptide-methionine (S)-S-oxide reductase MsrA [Alphaproteobacteria bacterium]|nr:peptide-methionine (S)-S-oxide reductase MsrA [Alphaproteobacteria bacterium]